MYPWSFQPGTPIKGQTHHTQHNSIKNGISSTNNPSPPHHPHPILRWLHRPLRPLPPLGTCHRPRQRDPLLRESRHRVATLTRRRHRQLRQKPASQLRHRVSDVHYTVGRPSKSNRPLKHSAKKVGVKGSHV